MRRWVIVGVVVVALGALTAIALPFLSSRSAGAKCPLTFAEFAVAPKDGAVRVAGRVTYPDGAPFAKGPVDVNLTFMMPGCGALPFAVTTDGRGRFDADSPPKQPTCILQGGTATARTKAGCDLEGITQATW